MDLSYVIIPDNIQSYMDESFGYAKAKHKNLLESKEPLPRTESRFAWERVREFIWTLPPEEQADFLMVESTEIRHLEGVSRIELYCRNIWFGGTVYAHYWYEEYLNARMYGIKCLENPAFSEILKGIPGATREERLNDFCKLRLICYGFWRLLHSVRGAFADKMIQFISSFSSEVQPGPYLMFEACGAQDNGMPIAKAQYYDGSPETVLKKGIVTTWPFPVNGKKIRVKIRLTWVTFNEDGDYPPIGEQVLFIEPTNEPLTKKNPKGRIRLFGKTDTQQTLCLPVVSGGKHASLIGYRDDYCDYTHQWVGTWREGKPFPMAVWWDGSST